MAFAPVVTGTVRDMVRSGNTIYIGGYFTSVGGQTGFRNLARYSAITGAVDTTWKPQLINNEIRSIVLSPDKQSIYIASNFPGYYVQKWSTVTATQQNFVSLSGNTVGCNKLLLDGNYLYAIGDFTTATPYGGSGISRGRVVKIDITGNSNQGSVETAFNINITLSTPVNIVQDNDYLYVGGDFTTASSKTVNRIVKVNKSDGAVASDWPTGAGKGFSAGTVRAIILGSDGNLYVSGQGLTSFSGTAVDNIAKISKTGVLDATFQSTNLSLLHIYDILEYSGSLYVACGTRASGNAGVAAVLKNTNGLSGFTFDSSFISQIDTANGSNGCRRIVFDGQNFMLGLTGTTYTGGAAYTATNTAHVAVSPTTGARVETQSDTVSPTVTLSSGSVSSGGTTALASVPMTVTFSESVTGFVAGDITVSGGSVSGFSGSGSSYTFNFIPSGDGAKSVSVASGVCQDSFGNTNSASSSFTFTVDTVQPTVSLSSTVANGGSSTSSSVSMTATFSESVTGFALGDISVTNGSASNLSGSGSVYTFDVAPTSLGSVSVSIVVNAAQDSAGNNSQASSSYSWTKTSATQPILTPTSPSVVRKQILSMSMSKSELQSLTGVSQGVWKRMLVVYTSAGNKTVVCSYKPAAATRASRFRANINSSATYTMAKIIIVKTDGTHVITERAAVSSPSQYDVSVT